MSDPSGIQVFSGPFIDEYLAREGSLAQAVDGKTIFLGTASREFSRSQRHLLLLHEVAHTYQLSHPGSDPISSLEDEAWEAASAWAAGKPFRVSGRGKGRLNACAIIQGGKREQKSAKPWYSSNPVEPLGNGSSVTVKATVRLNPMTLESIFDTIIRRKETEFVIVCHGFETELAIPLYTGSPLGTIMENVTRLGADQSFEYGGAKTPIIADKDVFRQGTEAKTKELREKMNLVRGRKISHLAFRSCNLGKTADTLIPFRDLFGAASVSAPKLLDSYGNFKPLIGRNVQGWAELKRKREGYRVWMDKGVAFGVRKGSDRTTYKIVSKAPGNSDFAEWVRAHVADRAGAGDHLYYHAVKDENVPDPKDPCIYFVRDDKFANNLTYYPK